VKAVRRIASLLALLAALAVAPSASAAVTAATAPTHTVRVGKLRLGYRAFGAGRPVVFIQGLGGTMDGWDPTFLDALAAKGHRVVVFDNEGIGRSTTLPGPLTIRRMGDDAAGLIRALHLGRPDVVGWSMGGMIAQSLAVRHPRSLLRLVLLATAPGDGKATAPLADALSVLTGGGNDPLAVLNLLFPPDQTAARDHFAADLALRKKLSPTAPPLVTARQLGASASWTTGGDRDGKRVAKLRLTVLVGGGEDDHLLPVANQRHLAKIIHGAKLVTYPDAAHAFFFQDAADFLPRLVAFLRR
jgi:pimeloyl-ACP methyl ester carboxylesterase